MTESEWLRISAHITTTWPNQPSLPAAVKEGYELLSDLTVGQVRTAVDALLLDGREFAPTAGQIRLKAAELEEPRAVWGEDWNEIQRKIHECGGYVDPETIRWTSPHLAELVRLRGWIYLCTSTDEPSVMEAQTRGLWESLRKRRIEDRAYKPLRHAGFRRLRDLKQLVPHGSQLPPPQ